MTSFAHGALNCPSDGYTGLDEIFGTLKKLKDADPADSLHASLDAAKKQDIVTVATQWLSASLVQKMWEGPY